MHARVRDLIDYAALCGFTLDGTDGQGHYCLVHPNGASTRIAATPGDFRGDKNARATMRRLSGVTPPRPRAGHYRKGERRERFSMRDALRERNPHASGYYTVGAPERVEHEPIGLQRLRAEQTRLEAEYTEFPSERTRMMLRDVTSRIALGLF